MEAARTRGLVGVRCWVWVIRVYPGMGTYPGVPKTHTPETWVQYPSTQNPYPPIPGYTQNPYPHTQNLTLVASAKNFERPRTKGPLFSRRVSHLHRARPA